MGMMGAAEIKNLKTDFLGTLNGKDNFTYSQAAEK
jgi:hypothetical protein